MKLALALLSLFATVFTWWIKNQSTKKEEKDATKKEIHEAIASKDVSRIHAVIDRLRVLS
jgi:hypothetical protein